MLLFSVKISVILRDDTGCIVPGGELEKGSCKWNMCILLWCHNVSPQVAMCSSCLWCFQISHNKRGWQRRSAESSVHNVVLTTGACVGAALWWFKLKHEIIKWQMMDCQPVYHTKVIECAILKLGRGNWCSQWLLQNIVHCDVWRTGRVVRCSQVGNSVPCTVKWYTVVHLRFRGAGFLCWNHAPTEIGACAWLQR